jgi:hypothetical protein
LIKALERWLAGLLNNLVKRMRPPQQAPAERQPQPRARINALASPWRIYRLYARPSQLLLRNEQGKVIDIGVVTPTTPNFDYQLNSGAGKGNGFASLATLLESVADTMTAGQIEADLKRLPVHTLVSSADLDRSVYLDVSMRVDG